jgi:hypothetical protein
LADNQVLARRVASCQFLVPLWMLQACDCTLQRLELKWRSDNSATIFRGRSCLSLCHTRPGPRIIKSRIHYSSEMKCSYALSWVILGYKGNVVTCLTQRSFTLNRMPCGDKYQSWEGRQ